MASALMIVLAASGLVSAGVPAKNTAPVAQPAGMVNAAPKAQAGVCLVPVLKGKVTKLSSIRKARDGRSCSFQYMQGTAAAAPASGGLGTVGTVVIGAATTGVVGGAVGGGIAGAIENNNNNQVNP